MPAYNIRLSNSVYAGSSITTFTRGEPASKRRPNLQGDFTMNTFRLRYDQFTPEERVHLVLAAAARGDADEAARLDGAAPPPRPARAPRGWPARWPAGPPAPAARAAR